MTAHHFPEEACDPTCRECNREPCVCAEMTDSMTTCEARGPRLVGPHGGLRQLMPNPDEHDLSDSLFEAIWQVTKTLDVNAPEYYVGYCGMNGSHVMLILNAVRAELAAQSRELASLRAKVGMLEATTIGYVNRYRGKGDAIWSGRTIFDSVNAATSCPCASRDAYIETCRLVAIERRKG